MTALPLILLAVAAPPEPAPPTAEALIEAVDRNLTFETRRAVTKMIVEGKRRKRVYEMVSYGRGEDDTAVEFRSPRRDKGTRLLKLGDELWMYLPSIDRVQKISGHMLRQGLMGSDVSYEDLMASREWLNRYTAKVLGAEPRQGRDCWKVELVARDDTVAYPRRVTWIDKEQMLPLEQELYALSGMLLKRWTMSDVRTFEGGRRFPTRMTIRDMVKKTSVTHIELSEMRFGVDLEREVFSRRWLQRR